jgi:DNA (cytosine-5)-methyltransferase 1
MTHGSLFSGIGGFDLAAEWMGWENVFHCEWNEFGKKVLKYYWPNAISYDDITKTDFTIHRGKIDILTGGFPCQPYSAAGKRLGKEDSRHLWPEMLRAIREISPRWVVGENVRGLTNWNGGMVFDEVQADLEAEGYQVLPFLLPACAVNAPHRRDRIWFIAKNASSDGCVQREFSKEGTEVRQQRDTFSGDTERICGTKMAGIATNTNGTRWKKLNSATESSKKKFNSGDATNADEIGLCNTKQIRELARERFSIYGIRNFWGQFPTQPPVCSRDDGFPPELDGITFSKWRNESIKAYGNAIVPQVAYQIFKAIQRYETIANA